MDRNDTMNDYYEAVLRSSTLPMVPKRDAAESFSRVTGSHKLRTASRCHCQPPRDVEFWLRAPADRIGSRGDARHARGRRRSPTQSLAGEDNWGSSLESAILVRGEDCFSDFRSSLTL